MDRELSKSKLEQRLGSFQPINEQTLATTKVKKSYERSPITNNSAKPTQPRQISKQTKPTQIASAELYATYQREMGERTESRTISLHKAKDQHKDQIQRAKANAVNKRRWIKALTQPGLSKKLLLGLVGKSLRENIKDINTTYQHTRQRLYRQHMRQSWLD